jgi:hypothetical protein
MPGGVDDRVHQGVQAEAPHLPLVASFITCSRSAALIVLPTPSR